MIASWQKAFSKLPLSKGKSPYAPGVPLQIHEMEDLKAFLDLVHVKHCLLRPFFERKDYPLVEARELLPSFELDFYEYKDLPGFSMVVLDRPLNYFQEVFQFDIMHNVMSLPDKTVGKSCPLETSVLAQNLETLRNRLPRRTQDELISRFQNKDVCYLENYPALIPYLLMLDRAHLVAKDDLGEFYLGGVYASFPSDLDTELKRFGLKIGKFSVGDNIKYELNRLFVYQFLMELYGFPIASERRTSSALFARRLFKMGEKFMVRVLGQTDRVITTLYSHPQAKYYPRVEKLALVAVDKDQKEVIKLCSEGGFFVDEERRVVILRAVYRQHKFNPSNVRQDRALSVTAQYVIHPQTGEQLGGVNIIKDTYNMFLRLNDIVRGEYNGRITYKRSEIIESTDTHDKRLKFLYAWLTKHQRRIIAYSDEFYGNVVKVLDNYLLNPDNFEVFNGLNDLYREVWSKYSYIQQARKIRVLEDLQYRLYKGQRISYSDMLKHITEILGDLKFEIVNYFDPLVKNVLSIGENILNDRYLLRVYVLKKDEDLKPYGLRIKKLYHRLVALLDEFQSIRKSRVSRTSQGMAQTAT